VGYINLFVNNESVELSALKRILSSTTGTGLSVHRTTRNRNQKDPEDVLYYYEGGDGVLMKLVSDLKSSGVISDPLEKILVTAGEAK